MNLLLLTDEDCLEGGRVEVGGRRLEHVRQVLRSSVGDELVVGRLGGRIGRGRVVALDHRRLELEVTLGEEPPAPLRVTLVLAIPRPPVLRRLLQAVTSMGVKRIVLLQTARVEKSYWRSSTLEAAALRRHLTLGLEQGRDTVLPEVLCRRRFRPFVEDELPAWLEQRVGLVAHPGAVERHARPGPQPVTLLVGPEGGWVPFELDRLAWAGAVPFRVGERPLRVETAVVAALALLT